MTEHNPVVIADRYEVVGTLGEGGMGVVYKARDRLLQTTVALKVMREMDVASTSRMMLRFQQEAKTAGRLNHPNIARVMDFGQLSGKLYMVMELVDGSPLSQRIEERGHLNAHDALPMFIDICEGLEHAHKMGVLHRDLKPSNIILTTGDGIEFAKIVDFGIAKMMQSQELTATGAQVGSPLYMSPEQVKGKESDERSDIYGMGCLMYEVLSGTVPIRGETTLDTLHKKTTEPAPKLAQANPDIPEQLQEIVDRCLMIDPDDRFNKISDLLTALTEFSGSFAQEQELFLSDQIDNEAPVKNSSNKTALLLCAGGLIVLSIATLIAWLAASQTSSESAPGRIGFVPEEPDPVETGLKMLNDGKPFKFITPDEVEVNSAFQNVDSRFKELQNVKLTRLGIEQGADASGSGLQFIDKNLKELDLDHCLFQSKNLRLVGRFSNLEMLTLRFIDIKNTDLKHLESLKNLKRLDIAGLKLMDCEGFKFVEKLKSLEYLYITDCPKLGDGFASTLAKLPKLAILGISKMPLHAGDIKQLGKVKSLFILDLSHPTLNSESLDALSHLDQIEHLKLRDMELATQQIKTLSKMPKLIAFTYGGRSRKISPEAIETMKELKTLRNIDFEHTELGREELQALARLPQVTGVTFLDVEMPPGSLSYLLDMPSLLSIRNCNKSIELGEFNRFVHEYGRKWKRRISSSIEN